MQTWHMTCNRIIKQHNITNKVNNMSKVNNITIITNNDMGTTFRGVRRVVTLSEEGSPQIRYNGKTYTVENDTFNGKPITNRFSLTFNMGETGAIWL